MDNLFMALESAAVRPFSQQTQAGGALPYKKSDALSNISISKGKDIDQKLYLTFIAKCNLMHMYLQFSFLFPPPYFRAAFTNKTQQVYLSESFVETVLELKGRP